MSRLKAIFWVEALIRRAESGLAAAYVIRRGDEDAGAVLVKVVRSRTECVLFVPVRDEHGEPLWIRYRKGEPDEATVDEYCRERCEDDPDLWLIEIEDRQGRHFLTEAVEEL